MSTATAAMRPTTLIATLAKLSRVRQPAVVWGAPGTGKSDCVAQAVDALNADLPAAAAAAVVAKGKKPAKGIAAPGDDRWGFIDFRASLRDPVDLLGVQTVVDGRAKWAAPAELPTAGRGVLFLDELDKAVPQVQNALLQLCLTFRLGEYVLPEGWTIIAACNRLEDRAHGHRLGTALASRFLHLDYEPHLDDWQAWAARTGIAPEVRGFLNFMPHYLHKFEAATNPRAFPCPRTWAFVSRVLPCSDDATIFQLVTGCVGSLPAVDFVNFVRMYRQLPDVEQILTTPATATVPTAPDVLFAVANAVTEKVRLNPARAAAALKYADRLPNEFGACLFRNVVSVNRKSIALPEARPLLTKHKDVLIAAGASAAA